MEKIFTKVLFIAPDDKYGGIGSVVRTYAKHMKGFTCIATYPSASIQSKTLFYLLSVLQIIKRLSLDANIRIIHLHSASNGSFLRKALIALVGMTFGKKIIFHLHGGSFKDFYMKASIFKPAIRMVLKKSDVVICLSQQWHEYYSNVLGLPNVVCISNPVELSDGEDYFKVGPVLTLLFLGKICDDKGIFDLIEYLRTSKYFLKNKIRLFVGGVGEHDRLLTIIADPFFNGNIEYHGWVEDSIKRQLLEEADIFILPSRFEGLPVSILEAMAFRKPIIATDVGGIPSIVKNGVNGWLLDPQNLSQLDSVFEQIFDNRPLLHSYGLNSYREASKYSSKEVIKTLSIMYESLCAK